MAIRWHLPNWRTTKFLQHASALPQQFKLAGGIFASLLASLLGLVVLALIILGLIDWNWLRGPINAWASAASGRDVRIEGNLSGKIFSLTPRLEAEAVSIGNPEWVEEKEMARIQRLEVAVKLLPLFVGDVILPLLKIDGADADFRRDASGRANWVFDKGEDDEPAVLPVIHELLIQDTKIDIDDKERGIRFTGTMYSHENSRTPTRRPFNLTGQGTLNGNPFKLVVTGSSLLKADEDVPYAFVGDLRAGDIRITADGHIAKPFDLGAVTANVTAKGSDLADLYLFTGLALPNTPPYNLKGKLKRRGTHYEVTAFHGVLGDSDISGKINVETKGERPFLSATLASKVLDFDDLGAVLGGAPAVGKGETIAPAQVRDARQGDASGRVLPDAPLDVTRVRKMDARVSYKAQSVRAQDVPLERVALELQLDNGVLSLDPLSFGFPKGKLAGSVRIDARPDVPITDIDMSLKDTQLQTLFDLKGDQPAIEGPIYARGKLRGVGKSVRQAAATADGAVTFVVPKGEIRAGYAELLGVDVARALKIFISDSEKQKELRCGVVDFQAKKGVLNARTMVVDTDNVLITGEGNINLADENIDLKIKGHTKKLSLRLRAPINIGGTLGDPDIGIGAGPTAAQVGAAAVAGALLTPVAAILPFVDPGLAKDANCAALLAEPNARKTKQ